MSKLQEKRQFWVILIIVFLGFVGISMPYLIFPYLLLKPEYGLISGEWSSTIRGLFFGITLAAYPLGQFFGSPILGSLSDDYGRKKTIAASIFIAAAATLLSGFAIDWHQLWLLITCRFIAGFMEGNIAIARAMATDLKTISKHNSLGKVNAMASIGYLLGPLIGGLLADQCVFEYLTPATPFYLMSVLFLFLGCLSILTLEETAPTKKEKRRSIWNRLNLLKSMSSILSNQRLYFLMMTSTIFTLAVDIFYEFGPVYLTLKWNLTPSRLIVYNGILCITLAIGNGWCPAFLSKRVSNQTAITYALLGFALFLAGTLIVNTVASMLTLFALSGLAIGIGVTLLTVNISDAAPTTIQGEVMGVQLSLRVLGDALICLLGGVMLLFSSKLILIIAAVMSLFITLYYTRRTQKN